MATKKDKETRRATLRPHPIRDQIVDTMRSYRKPISPTQLSRVTGGTLGSVAYHVRTLVAAGVIELADEQRVRGAVEHLYTLVGSMADDVNTVSDPIEMLLAVCGALTVPDPEGGYPTPVSLDDRAREDLGSVIASIRPQVRAISEAATARAA
jgi:DNA-binding transcriptional ArsR family regulator